MAKTNIVQYHGVGRRKKSIARVFLRPGTGNIEVNGKTLEEYLPLETLRMVVKSPLELTNTLDQFDVVINVHGGGYTGQAGAMRHGVTRALMEASDDYRPVLKAAGFVTRDPRAKERKKYGLKAARRAPQVLKTLIVVLRRSKKYLDFVRSLDTSFFNLTLIYVKIRIIMKL